VDPNIAADVQRAILELVKADRLLASISINDAKAVTVTDPVKQKKYEQELEKAEGEMLKAEEEVDKGEYDKAIDHYRKAWEHAQAAIKLGE
jgi:methionyl-tRNA synthetase